MGILGILISITLVVLAVYLKGKAWMALWMISTTKSSKTATMKQPSKPIGIQ